jgi:membrane fusion protein (multidrug efflux system)
MVSGRIAQFHVEENDRVEQGQVLAEIDPIHYRDQVEQARGKLDLADAELAKLKKEVPLQIDVAKQTLVAAQTDEARAKDNLKLTTDEVNKTIDEAKAAVEVAKANLTLAKQEYDRWTTLAAQDATTKRKAEEVTRAYDAAKAELRLAEAKLAKAEAARTKIDVARRDLEVSQSLVAKAGKALDLAETGYDQIRVREEMVKDAQIALDTAQHEFEFTKVRAPFPGVVVKRYRHLGDFASPGVAILSMFNPDLIYVTANLEETRLRGVAPGNPVELQLDAFSEPFRGRVVWLDKSTGAQFSLMPRNVVSGEFTKVVQRVPVRIAIEKDDRWPLLRAGLSVTVDIAHGEGDPQWAEQAAQEMRDQETRYNQSQRPDRKADPGDQP